ncbi:MAG TPA: hypothetical protein VFA07_09745 [Chthonomonadaceae bacterium]|nr:hypothetical protein [Chthonomonadaceae bacterium]
MNYRTTPARPLRAATNIVSWDDRVQATADMLALLPIVNVPASVVSGLISFKKRDYVGAALSVVGMIPVEGEWATAVKIARGAGHFHHAVKVGARIAKIASVAA